MFLPRWTAGLFGALALLAGSAEGQNASVGLPSLPVRGALVGTDLVPVEPAGSGYLNQTTVQTFDTFVASQAHTWTLEQTMPASAAGSAGFNLPQGAAPTAPVNGDLWTTSAGLFVRIAGSTVGPLGGGGGGVTTTGTPASGNLTKFSGAATITNGDLSGDCTTSGTLAITCTKTGGVAFATSATTDTTNAANIASGALNIARLPSIAANTALMNATGSAAVPTAVALPSCSGANQALNYTSGTGPGCATISGASGANPSATIGLSAVNGSAPTFLRSDGAPALSQTISPTMTGNWTFAPTSVASPAAVTEQFVPSVSSGTLNTAGANTTIAGSQSTGNQNGGEIDIQVSPSGSAGSSVNALATAVRVMNIGDGISTAPGLVGNSGQIMMFDHVDINNDLRNSTSSRKLYSVQNPTVSGTGLGTSPSITANGTGAMDITVGSSPSAASFTITFIAASTGWACSGSDITTQSTTDFVLKQVGGTTTTAVMEMFTDTATAAAPAASDHIRLVCWAI